MSMLEVAGKKILVIGLARSGLAAVRFLARKGARKIIVNEYKRVSEMKDGESILRELPNHDELTLVDGGHPPALLEQADLIIKSPGVPPNIPLLVKAEERKIPVLTEIELAYHYIKAPIIGITGTNGKTTTTMLTGDIFKEAGGGNIFVAGNIGVPMCFFADDTSPTDTIVAELSSFQLESIQDFRCSVAVILNITEDHLDYHGTFAKYVEAKAKILQNQRKTDIAVLNVDYPEVRALEENVRGRLMRFSRTSSLDEGVFVREGKIIIRNAGREQVVCSVGEVGIPGPHNLENALAATAAAWAGGVAPAIIARGLQHFRGVEHRVELVDEINGVKFVNDSKGTNPEAAIKALYSFPGKKVLIAGGKDKGAQFDELAEHIRKEVSYLVLLGETADKIVSAAEQVGYNRWIKVGTLEEAIKEAYKCARPGETVLLSPACASWDMFSNFEERGNLFKKVVESLKGAPVYDENA